MRIELVRRCKGMWRKRGGAGEEMEQSRAVEAYTQGERGEQHEWRCWVLQLEHAREKRRGCEWNGAERWEYTRRWNEAERRELRGAVT